MRRRAPAGRKAPNIDELFERAIGFWKTVGHHSVPRAFRASAAPAAAPADTAHPMAPGAMAARA